MHTRIEHTPWEQWLTDAVHIARESNHLCQVGHKEMQSLLHLDNIKDIVNYTTQQQVSSGDMKSNMASALASFLPDHPFWGSQTILTQTQRFGVLWKEHLVSSRWNLLPIVGMVFNWPSCGSGSGSNSSSPMVPSSMPLLAYCISQLKTETSQWTLISTSSQGSSPSLEGERWSWKYCISRIRTSRGQTKSCSTENGKIYEGSHMSNNYQLVTTCVGSYTCMLKHKYHLTLFSTLSIITIDACMHECALHVC